MDKQIDTLIADANCASFPSDSAFEHGQIVGGKYKVLSILGRGGMGTVYLVEQVFLKKEFALKTLERHQISDVSVRRFQLEAKAASLLNHPNLVQVHDFGLLENGQPFLVMDFVQGVSLAEHLRQNGPLTVDQAAQVFTQACFGLMYAHDSGVIHRDIKPSNIMLVQDAPLGTEGSVRIVDFGIAKFTSTDDGEIQALTRTGEIFGSPLYMSPEQCMGGKIDHRCDIYALGCVLYEALTGAPPHMGSSVLATMLLHQSEKALPLKEASLGRHFPEHLESIVGKMLQKSPAERYKNLGMVAHHMSGVCSEAALSEFRVSRSTPAKPPKMISLSVKRLAVLLSASAVSAAILSGFIVISWNQEHLKHMLPATYCNSDLNSAYARDKSFRDDTGLLDGFADLKMERFSSARSVRTVMQADALNSNAAEAERSIR